MSKRQFKSQASSFRAGSTANSFGGAAFRSGSASILSYVQEPPDYSKIQDSNIVVAFKNLSKKDGTTKAKALEELQAHVTAPGSTLEDGFLDSWALLFPRLSIDNTRRVRQLAHALNGEIWSRCGKRTVKHLPRIAGPWLAGTFDIDRAVSRAALDALNLVFPTTEKVQGLRKTFQRPILEFCADAVLRETVQTLSDERAVSSDDAEATFARVVATSSSTVTSLMNNDELSKEDELLGEIFDDTKLWGFVHHSDAAVRRAADKLVLTCLEKQSALIKKDLASVSNAYVYAGLHSDQTGSALDFVQTLEALTAAFPTIWTDAYSAKRPALSRLRHFLKKGAQSAPSSFWDCLSRLYQKLPTHLLPTTEKEAEDLLSAAREGVSKKEERFNASVAWQSYFALVNAITSTMQEKEAEAILDRNIAPLFRQYLYPSTETSDWTVNGAKPEWVISRAAATKRLDPLLVEEWPRFARTLVEDAKLSQPEQSKEFDKSQKHVAATGERLAILQRQIFDHHSLDDLKTTMSSCSYQMIEECVALLKARRGKPYGAAAIIESLLKSSIQDFMLDEGFWPMLDAFVLQDIPNYTFSPSRAHLVRALYALGADKPVFPEAFERLLLSILQADQAVNAKIGALADTLFPGMPMKAVSLARDLDELQVFMTQNVATDIVRDRASFLSTLLNLGVISAETTNTILSDLTISLELEDRSQASLAALDVISQTNRSAVDAFLSKPGDSGQQLLPRVLHLEQSADDEVSAKASTLYTRLSSVMEDTTSDKKYSILLQNLENVDENSLTIDALHDLTDRLLGPKPDVQNPSDVLPSFETWWVALSTTITTPKASLALLSPLGGAVYLLHPSATHSKVQYDAEGLSQALRIAMYVSRLLTDFALLEKLGSQIEMALALLHVSTIVAEDNISIIGANHMWIPNDEYQTESAVVEFVSQANLVVMQYCSKRSQAFNPEHSTTFSQFSATYEKLRQDQDPESPVAYYIALSSAKLHGNLFEVQGFSKDLSKRCEDVLKSVRTTGGPASLIYCIVGLQYPLAGSPVLGRLCNELVSDLTDLDIAVNEQKGLQLLTILNVILHTQEGTVSGIAKQRLIFLVKHILPWLESETGSLVKAEVCKALCLLLAGMHDIYGDQWERALSFTVDYWNSSTATSDGMAIQEDRVVLENCTLRLYSAFKKLAKSDEPNDDLIDALHDKEDQTQEGLIRLLLCAKGLSDETHQPLMVTHELLARQVACLPPKAVQEIGNLYPLLQTPSRPVQQAAFALLHKQIPPMQEQISFDAALDNKTAQLPTELLSLIQEAPTLDSLTDVSFERVVPPFLQGYLFSWRLLFDHFNGSSYRVKGDYIEQLKGSASLTGLLDFTFEFLGHTRGKPVDVSKFEIQEYSSDVEQNPEKDVQWLLTHLYFLALNHLPNLVKSYYLNLRSRQTSIAVESWTAKYISPLVITPALEGVIEWTEKSSKEDAEYEKMSVKVGMKSREITVSYVIDEQTMAIRVILPESYPLASAQVVGVSRVAVKEEKWQSWLRNCQGVIAFSNGSITDGLSAWRKNVTGALKGQSECAICYSIISADKQLPSKRCPTCKNLFHSSCLFKWFKTSNASTCPLCRNPFNFN